MPNTNNNRGALANRGSCRPGQNRRYGVPCVWVVDDPTGGYYTSKPSNVSVVSVMAGMPTTVPPNLHEAWTKACRCMCGVDGRWYPCYKCKQERLGAGLWVPNQIRKSGCLCLPTSIWDVLPLVPTPLLPSGQNYCMSGSLREPTYCLRGATVIAGVA